jgi:hypothetical protein
MTSDNTGHAPLCTADRISHADTPVVLINQAEVMFVLLYRYKENAH